MSEKLWSVRRKSDGVEVYRYYHTTALDLGGYEFSTHDHIDITPTDPQAPPITVYGGRRELSHREFLGLFNQQERIQIRQFSKGNSAAAQALDDYLFMLQVADSIRLDNQDVIDGLTMLEHGGILGPGRKGEILNG